ncbi:MAG: hypothetical protein JW925_04375 [Syntrophaceae bacterium]|nr:hypothetical protein [Syntrophaceae bacterium]
MVVDGSEYLENVLAIAVGKIIYPENFKDVKMDKKRMKYTRFFLDAQFIKKWKKRTARSGKIHRTYDKNPFPSKIGRNDQVKIHSECKHVSFMMATKGREIS